MSRFKITDSSENFLYSHFRNYAPALDEKGGIIAEKVFPLFSENFFGAYFGLVMYTWELIDVTEKVAFQMSNNNIYLAVLMREFFRGGIFTKKMLS